MTAAFEVSNLPNNSGELDGVDLTRSLIILLNLDSRLLMILVEFLTMKEY